MIHVSWSHLTSFQFMPPAGVEETEKAGEALKMSDMEGLLSPGVPAP